MRHALKLTGLAVATAAIVGACTHAGAPGEAAPSMTVNEAMLNVFQPDFQNYGDTAFWAYDDNGELDGSLLTEEQWTLMGEGAVALRDTALLLAASEHFVVAAPGVDLGFEGNGFVPPEQVQANIDANPDGFRAMMEAFAAEADLAVTAIETRDAALLVAQSDNLYNTCKGCHMTFWYPGQR